MDTKARERLSLLKRKAWASVDTKQTEDVRRYFDEMKALAPDDPVIPVEEGVAFFKMELLEDALACFDAVLESSPEMLLALNNQGKIRSRLGRREEARESYERALAVDGSHAKTWANLAELHEETEDWAAAEESWTRVMELTPKDVNAWHRRGRALHELGRHEEALDILDRACKKVEDFGPAQLDRGRVMEALGRAEDAVECYAIAAKAVGKTDPVPHVMLGKLLYGMSHFREAVTAFDVAIDADQDHPDGWIGKGASLLATGEKARGYLNIGMGRSLKGEHDKALEELDKALEERERYPEAWANRAVVCEKLERYDEAVACYDRALAIEPGQIAIWHNKGVLLYRKMDRKADGIHCFKRAIQLDPPRYFKYPKVIRKAIDAS